jgi:hypothetical protein
MYVQLECFIFTDDQNKRACKNDLMGGGWVYPNPGWGYGISCVEFVNIRKHVCESEKGTRTGLLQLSHQ